MIDKFVSYKKPERLEYYLLAEPDKHLVIIHKKAMNDNWQSKTYTSITDIIDLPKLKVSIPLKDIYQS